MERQVVHKLKQRGLVQPMERMELLMERKLEQRMERMEQPMEHMG
jgi:hypothetical protein